MLGDDAGAGGGVLAVGDDEPDALLLDEVGELFGEDGAAGPADDVADDENANRFVSSPACRRLPAGGYLANSTDRVSRSTVTLISPG